MTAYWLSLTIIIPVVNQVKILQIGPVPPEAGGAFVGGIASHVWSLTEQLTKSGCKASILTDSYSVKEQCPTSVNDIKIYKAPMSLAPEEREYFVKLFMEHKKNGAYPKFSTRIASELKVHQEIINEVAPDILHIHTIDDRFFFAYEASEGKIPFVVTIHSSHFIDFCDPDEKNVRSEFIRLNLDKAKNLVFVSNFVKERHASLLKKDFSEHKIKIIHNPINASLFHLIPKDIARQIIGEQLDIPIILFVGQLIPRKGVDLLIKAASILKSRGIFFKLIIIGDGAEKSKVEELIHQKGMSSEIAFLGQKLHTELPYYYCATDLFLLPSAMEGFALVLVEAMLSGCPAIGTPESLKELVVSDEYGYHIPSRTPEFIAKAIENGISRSWERNKIRQFALNFDWNCKLREFITFYEEIISS